MYTQPQTGDGLSLLRWVIKSQLIRFTKYHNCTVLPLVCEFGTIIPANAFCAKGMDIDKHPETIEKSTPLES